MTPKRAAARRRSRSTFSRPPRRRRRRTSSPRRATRRSVSTGMRSSARPATTSSARLRERRSVHDDRAEHRHKQLHRHERRQRHALLLRRLRAQRRERERRLQSGRRHAERAASAGPLAKIYFVDIGQGAATLIVSPTGKSMLVDGGPTGQGNAKAHPAPQLVLGHRARSTTSCSRTTTSITTPVSPK